jgi:hypothetical protein
MECRDANTEYQRTYRATGSGTTKDNVKRLRPGQPALIGEVEQSVIDECEIHGSTGVRVLTARSLAKVLDDPNSAGRYVQTAKQLVPILQSLHGSGSGKRKGPSARLTLVAGMVKSRRPT